MSMTNVLDDVLGDSDGEFSVHSSEDEGESIREVPAPIVPPPSPPHIVEDSSTAVEGSSRAAVPQTKTKAAPKRKKTIAVAERPRKKKTANRVLPIEEVDEDIVSLHSGSSAEDVDSAEQQALARKKGKKAMPSGSQVPIEPYVPNWEQVSDSTLLDSPSTQLEWLQNILPTAEVSRYRESAPPHVRERLVASTVEMVRCVASELEAFNLQRFMAETGAGAAKDETGDADVQSLKDEAVLSRAAAEDAKKKLEDLWAAHNALLKENSLLKEEKGANERSAEKRIAELEGEVALLTEEKKFFLSEGIALVVRCIFQGPEFAAWSTKAMKAVAEAGKSSGALWMRKKFCRSVKLEDISCYLKDGKEIAANAMAEVQHLSFSLLNAISSRPTMSKEELKALCPAADPSTLDLGLGGETEETGASAPSTAG